MNLQDVHERLTAHFRRAELDQRPVGGGGKAWYADARAIMDRLDQVVGPDNWSDVCDVVDLTRAVVRCRLTVLGVSHDDFGHPNNGPNSPEAIKEAATDALRRAAVKFGIARYLYDLKPGQEPAWPNAPARDGASEQPSRAVVPAGRQNGAVEKRPESEPIVITLPPYPGAQWSDPLPDGTKTVRLDGIECYAEPSRKNPGILLYKTLDTCDVPGHLKVPWTTYLKEDGRLVPWYHTYNVVEEGTGLVSSAYCMMTNPG